MRATNPVTMEMSHDTSQDVVLATAERQTPDGRGLRKYYDRTENPEVDEEGVSQVQMT